jgi:hypothetical protein
VVNSQPCAEPRKPPSRCACSGTRKMVPVDGGASRAPLTARRCRGRSTEGGVSASALGGPERGTRRRQIARWCTRRPSGRRRGPPWTTWR